MDDLFESDYLQFSVYIYPSCSHLQYHIVNYLDDYFVGFNRCDNIQVILELNVRSLQA